MTTGPASSAIAWCIGSGACVKPSRARWNWRGELRADIDPEQVAFELFGIVLVLHHDSHLFGATDAIARATRAFDRLFASHAN